VQFENKVKKEMQGSRVIRGGMLIDGTGAPPAEDATVVIEGSKVAVVGRGRVQIPSGAQVIDAGGRTIMPGLMDCHLHLCSPESPGPRIRLDGMYITPSSAICWAVKHAKEVLEAGFTTVRDTGCMSIIAPLGDLAPLVSLRNAIRQGILLGPRIMVAGTVGMTAGHNDWDKPPAWPRESGETADGPWAIRKRVRELIREGVDLIKTFAGGGVFGSGEELWWRGYTVEELEAIVDEAHAQGKKVAVHVYAAPLIKNALRAGVDTIEHGSFMDDEVMRMMIERKATWVPTLTVYSKRYAEAHKDRPEAIMRKTEEVMKQASANFRKAHEAGVKIAMGTDLWVQYPPQPMFGDNAYELELYVENGMTEMEAIVASTKTAAETLGLGDQTGTIQQGKEADIILVEGNPLKDIRVLQDKKNIRMVMIGGDVKVNRGL